MTLTAKQLADGQLAASAAALYTAPASTTTYIKTITLDNTGAGANTCQLWLTPSGGTARRLAYVTLQANESFTMGSSLALDTGDAISGAATNANEVDYTVHGVEET